MWARLFTSAGTFGYDPFVHKRIDINILNRVNVLLLSHSNLGPVGKGRRGTRQKWIMQYIYKLTMYKYYIIQHNKLLIDDSHVWKMTCSPKIHDVFAQLRAASYDGVLKH